MTEYFEVRFSENLNFDVKLDLLKFLSVFSHNRSI